MNVEESLEFSKFSLRWYQEEIWDTIEEGRSKRVLYVAARRAGKDILFWNLAIRQCVKRVCLVHYVLPTYQQGRKCIFDALTINGIKFLDFLPKSQIAAINQAEMKIRFNNNSVLQIVGGDTYSSSMVGTNPYAVILSEYALMPHDIFDYIRPMLAANKGWCAFVGTPRGKNHMWQLWKMAQEWPEWKVFIHKASEIHHIDDEDLTREREQMDPGVYLQEYECSFDRGISGSFYGTYLDALKLKGQINYIAWEPGLLVYTAWDIGVNDATTIIFWQSVADGAVIRIIDCYSNTGLGLDHYAKVIQDKPYKYGKHFAPADIKVREWGGGAVTRFEKAAQLGINFTLIEQVSIIDGIENVWTHFNKFWIDQERCRSLINALENYRKEWNENQQRYLPIPVKSWCCHYCFTPDTLILTRSGMRPIIELNDNDEVLTLLGWRSCTKAQITRKNARLVEVKFTDGTKVKCTGDHMFLTDSGWISARKLTPNTKIQSSLMNLSNTSRAEFIDYMRMKDISLHSEENYIGMSGKVYSANVEPIVASTMSMETCQTMHCTILNVCPIKNTVIFRKRTIKVLAKFVAKLPKYGINLLKELFGIVNMPNSANHGKNGKESQRIVNTVSRNSLRLTEMVDRHKNIVMQTVKPLLVESVEPLKEKSDVCCISVPSTGHFSLSNGAIVKNCDALRYMCLAIHRTRKGMSPEDFDRKKAAALYGGQADLPRFFRDDPRYDRYR